MQRRQTRWLAGALALTLSACHQNADQPNNGDKADTAEPAQRPEEAEPPEPPSKPELASSAAAGDLREQADGLDYFLDLSLNEALAQAKAQDKKAVLIYFFSKRCSASRTMERTTLADESVVALLKQDTIPIWVDNEEQWMLPSIYRIAAVPTTVFLRPDGAEIERVVGAPGPEDFVSLASDYIRGQDDVDIARVRVLQARYSLARALVEKARYDEALTEYLLVLDESAKASQATFEDVGAWAIQGLVWLGADHDRAATALQSRYDAAAGRLLSGDATGVDLKMVTTINHNAGRAADSLALYDQVQAERPGDPLLPEWQGQLFDALLDAGRYEELASQGDLGERIERLFSGAAAHMPSPEDFDDPGAFRVANEQYERYFANRGARYYQLLLGLGDVESAETLAERLVEAVPGAGTLNNLAWAGYITGNPSEKDLERAHLADQLVFGGDAAITDTLARILAVRGQHEKAIKLVEEGLRVARTPQDLAVLRKTLSEIRISAKPAEES